LDQEIERILDEHRRLDAAAAELETVVLNGPAHADEVFRELSSFASRIAEHLLDEEHVLRSANLGGRKESPLDGRLAEDLTVLSQDWDEYLASWTPASAKAAWPSFAEHSLAMLGRVRRRIYRENVVLLQSASAPSRA
jgi:hypothetical protein